MPMMKYIGTSTVSQKTKNSRKSQRHEDAQHAGLQEQEEGVVFLQPVLDRVPTGQDGEEARCTVVSITSSSPKPSMPM